MSESARLACENGRSLRMARWLAPAILGLLGICPALAGVETEVAGVQIAPSVTVAGQELVLNGAGIRKKFFVKVYVGALYLPQRASAVEDVLKMDGPKRVFMHFLYKKVTTEQLVDGWNEGFEDNQTPESLKALDPRLQRFNGMFSDVHKGDEILLDYLPGKGTQVTIRGEGKGLIPGEDFYRALLSVWLGDEPADRGLKKAMLGD
jgi:hypothetical protein